MGAALAVFGKRVSIELQKQTADVKAAHLNSVLKWGLPVSNTKYQQL